MPNNKAAHRRRRQGRQAPPSCLCVAKHDCNVCSPLITGEETLGSIYSVPGKLVAAYVQALSGGWLFDVGAGTGAVLAGILHDPAAFAALPPDARPNFEHITCIDPSPSAHARNQEKTLVRYTPHETTLGGFCKWHEAALGAYRRGGRPVTLLVSWPLPTKACECCMKAATEEDTKRDIKGYDLRALLDLQPEWAVYLTGTHYTAEKDGTYATSFDAGGDDLHQKLLFPLEGGVTHGYKAEKVLTYVIADEVWGFMDGAERAVAHNPIERHGVRHLHLLRRIDVEPTPEQRRRLAAVPQGVVADTEQAGKDYRNALAEQTLRG